MISVGTCHDPLYIGQLGALPGERSELELADTRVWSVARTGGQIAATRSAYLDAATPGLERLYRFEGSATEVLDQTGNSAPAPLSSDAQIRVVPGAPIASPPAVTPPPGPSAEATW